MQCEKARVIMHESLDGELDQLTESQFIIHLASCSECARIFEQLKQTESFLNVHVTTIENVDDTIDQDKQTFQQRLRAYRLKRQLPPPKKRLIFRQWLKKRGGAMFISIALGALLGAGIVHIWHEVYNKNVLMVQSNSLQELIIENKQVIVPLNKTIQGDLIVRHGNVKVYGNIVGNLTVVDGEAEIVKGAKIEGNVKTVNRFMDWLH